MGQFTRAIVRKPGSNFSQGQTTHDSELPDLKMVKAQHMDYVWTLFSLGIEPKLLNEDPKYPDGCFVEDVAVITEKAAVICRPGHPSRQGEQKKIKTILKKHFDLKEIVAPGTVDGGDICRAGNHFFIGLSQRTNEAGALQLLQILSDLAYTGQVVPVVEALHLKSSLSWLGDNTLLLTEAYAARPEFKDYDLITVAPEESYAANCLSVNGVIIISAGFPKLQKALKDRGFSYLELEMSEFRKMDGSLTCLSLLW